MRLETETRAERLLSICQDRVSLITWGQLGLPLATIVHSWEPGVYLQEAQLMSSQQKLDTDKSERGETSVEIIYFSTNIFFLPVA